MEETTLQREPSPKRSKFLIFFIISIVIIVGAFGAWQFLGLKTEKSETATPTPTEFQLPTDEPTAHPTPQASPTAKPKDVSPPTSTPKPTVNPVDKTTGLDRSNFSIEVKNGSGVVGAAAKASDTLKSLGYNVVTVGNADNFDYKDLTIQAKSTKSDYLSLLKKDLGSNYTIGTTSAELSATSSADALVIVGK